MEIVLNALQMERNKIRVFVSFVLCADIKSV